MMRTYTRKTYLTKVSHANLSDFLDQARFLYNESLAERKEAWEEEQRSVTYHHQQATLTERRKDSAWSRFPRLGCNDLSSSVWIEPTINSFVKAATLGLRAGTMASIRSRIPRLPRLNRLENIIPIL